MKPRRKKGDLIKRLQEANERQKTKNVTFRLPVWLIERFQEVAHANGQKSVRVIETLLEDFIVEYGEDKRDAS